MVDLLSSYSEQIKGFNIYPRAFSPKGENIFLYGAPGVGKTSIALDSARNFKKIVYIDCLDSRLNLNDIKESLLKLFLEKKFDFLIVDNYDDNFIIPNFNNTILISSLDSSYIKNYKKFKILPLSFEEYLSFNKRTLSTESMFSNFIKEGNLVESTFLPDFKKTKRNVEVLKLAFKENFELFRALVSYQNLNFSINNFYTHLKLKIKISKDRLYAFMDYLIKSGSIYLIPYLYSKHSKNSAKKLFLYNFALPYMLNSAPNLQAILNNLLLCELLHKKEEIFYSDDCDFYMNETAFLVMPFANKEAIEYKASILSHKYNKVVILTMENILTSTQKNVSVNSFLQFLLG